MKTLREYINLIDRAQTISEATGDQKFDTMMGRIVDPVAALKQDRVYEEQLEDYVFEFMNEFLTRMDQLGIEVWRDNPQAGEDLTNPKFEQAYQQASLKAVQKFMQRKKLDTNNQQLVAQVKADFDENADQVNPVAGFLGSFMQGFTTLRPGEIDILSKADMFKKPGQNVDENQITQVANASQQRTLDRIGQRFGLPPGATMDQVQAAQQAYLAKTDPKAAAQYRQNMANINAGKTAQNKPVQLAPRAPDQDFQAALAAQKSGADPTEIMLAQPNIANNPKTLNAIAQSLGLPAGSTLDQVKKAAAARKAATKGLAEEEVDEAATPDAVRRIEQLVQYK